LRQIFAYHDTVIPGKDGKLIQAGDEVPTGSDVSGDKDTQGKDRERVHEAPMVVTA